MHFCMKANRYEAPRPILHSQLPRFSWGSGRCAWPLGRKRFIAGVSDIVID